MKTCVFIRRYFPALIADLLCPIGPNPDVVGRVLITEADIDPAIRERHAMNVAEAKLWMAREGINGPKPIINSRLKGQQ